MKYCSPELNHCKCFRRLCCFNSMNGGMLLSQASAQTKPQDTFWLNKPADLFNSCDIIPNKKMTTAERLNTLTRLLLLIVIVMYASGSKHYLTILSLGVITIILLHGYESKREGFKPRRGRHDPCHTCGFDSSMAYINTKYEETPSNQFSHVNYGPRSYTNAKYTVKPMYVPAPYREVWRNDVVFDGEFNPYQPTYQLIPQNCGGNSPNFSQPQTKTYYEDRDYVDNLPAVAPVRKESAMPAVQPAFMRDSMEFRNNIMGEYVDKFARERQHNCVGFKPGRKTF